MTMDPDHFRRKLEEAIAEGIADDPNEKPLMELLRFFASKETENLKDPHDGVHDENDTQ